METDFSHTLTKHKHVVLFTQKETEIILLFQSLPQEGAMEQVIAEAKPPSELV